jgi:hypothetical protein
LRSIRAGLAWLCLAGSSFAIDGPEEGAKPYDVLTPPALEQFLVVPLRVHVLTSEVLREVNCHLTDEDIARVVGKVNGVWNKAGIHFGLESIAREPAARVELFRLLLEESEGRPPLGAYRLLAPRDSSRFEGMQVYYIHEFAVNGVYLGDGVAFVKETAELRPVEGGIDEALPRVTAHEIAHALGLAHRQDETNLLASGTTGTILNTEEVKRARESALGLEAAHRAAELEGLIQDAEKNESRNEARRLRAWLDEVQRAAAQGSD